MITNPTREFRPGVRDVLVGRPLVTMGESMALLTTPSTGRVADHTHLELRIGGAESNVAIAVARLGGRSCWMGRVGDDGLGELVIARIRGEGVRVHAVLDQGPTSLMIKEQRTAFRSRVRYYRAHGPGSRLRPADIDARVVADAGVLHLTGITAALSDSARATLHAAIDLATSQGVLVSFDLNYRSLLWSPETARPVLTDLARRADLVFAGEDEALILFPDAEGPREAAHKIGRLGPQTVVIKRGAAGAAIWDSGTWTEHPAVPVIPVDTVGAGDAFVGGFLAERLAGVPTQAAMDTAIACGALAVTGRGDWENAPTRSDLADIAATEPVDR